MFVRVKSTPNSPRQSVQLVESYRHDGKARQRVVRHIGIATDELELQRLRDLGEYVKAKLEAESQPALRLVRPSHPLPRLGWHSSASTGAGDVSTEGGSDGQPLG